MERFNDTAIKIVSSANGSIKYYVYRFSSLLQMGADNCFNNINELISFSHKDYDSNDRMCNRYFIPISEEENNKTLEWFGNRTTAVGGVVGLESAQQLQNHQSYEPIIVAATVAMLGIVVIVSTVLYNYSKTNDREDPSSYMHYQLGQDDDAAITITGDTRISSTIYCTLVLDKNDLLI